MQVESFEELAKYLREFTSWNEGSVFDFGGAVHLMGASL